MSFATGSRSGFSYVVENIFGTTPTTPTMQDLPITGHRLNLEKQSVTGNQIRTDRQGGLLHHGQRSVNGVIEGELRRDAFDPLLEAAMMSSFSGGTMDIGTVLRSFTFEDRMHDVTLYRKFTGCVMDRMTVRVQPNALVGVSFGVMGQDQSSDMTSALDASYDAIGAQEPFDTYRIVLQEGGSTLAKASSLNFTLDNGMDPAFIIGAAAAPQVLLGRAKLSGEITVYVDNTTLLNKFINETETSLSVQMDDGVKRYTFLLPRIKYTGSTLSLENEQARLLTLPFEALRDATTGTMLRVTKVTL